jgi:uncharacterized protein
MPRRAPSSPIPAAAGIGLRFPHHRAVREDRPPIAWLEVHSENYMGGGAPIAHLEAIRRDYAVSLHGVGLSLGSAEGLDAAHLARLARLAKRIQPALVSEHLAWSVSAGRYYGDLLPLPLTDESLGVVCRNVEAMQQALGREVLLENPSSCLRYKHSTIPEWEFIAAVAARTGCGILCDVNNVYVSACNLGFDPRRYLEALPRACIGEIHLAGHQLRRLAGRRSIRIDDHGSRVGDAVWALYGDALALFGAMPTLVEWDTDVPPLGVLLEEAAKANAMLTAVTARAVTT